MTSPRPALGRGLSALIPQNAAQGSVDTVDIDLIAPNPHQPRQHFDQHALRELADSIREHGVLQPVIVSRTDSGAGPATYQLIAGERRWQAARMAGLARIPVLVKEAAGADALELALVENIQRADLNPIEEALAFRRLADEFGLTQDAVAKRVGRSRVSVANTTRLLQLEDDIKASLASGQISEGHARALLAIDDRRVRLDTWRKIVADALTVRQAEEIAKALKGGATAKGGKKLRRVDPHVRAVEDRIRGALGTRVSLVKSRTGGRIIISYHNDDELDGILRRMRA
jgi:ParB family chromosome partitioning protein